MLKILFFAQLKEHLQRSSMDVSIEIPQDCSVHQLISLLTEYDESLAILSHAQYLCAVNQQMSARDAIVQDGDEVAFFPAVTGG